MSTDWKPCHAYRKLPDGTVQVLTEKDGAREANTGKAKRRVPNVAQGFYANGVFHPIRASVDYDESRVGEKKAGKKRASKKAAKKTAKKKITTRASVATTKRKPAKKKLSPAQKKRAAGKSASPRPGARR